MDLGSNYKVIRTISPVAPDTDWVLLQAVPVETVDGTSFTSVEVKLVARAANMSSISGTCTAQVVGVSDDGEVSELSSQQVSYGITWTANAGAVFAVRITGATGAPHRITVAAKGLP